MITIKSYHTDSVLQRELGLDVFPGGEVVVPTRVTKVGEVVSTWLHTYLSVWSCTYLRYKYLTFLHTCAYVRKRPDIVLYFTAVWIQIEIPTKPLRYLQFRRKEIQKEVKGETKLNQSKSLAVVLIVWSAVRNSFRKLNWNTMFSVKRCESTYCNQIQVLWGGLRRVHYPDLDLQRKFKCMESETFVALWCKCTMSPFLNLFMFPILHILI